MSCSDDDRVMLRDLAILHSQAMLAQLPPSISYATIFSTNGEAPNELSFCSSLDFSSLKHLLQRLLERVDQEIAKEQAIRRRELN